MGTHRLQNRYEYGNGGSLLDRYICERELERVRGGHRCFYKGCYAMTLAKSFHHAVFIFMLAVAFFAGALNAGRADIIEQMAYKELISLSLRDLSNMDVSKVNI